MLRLISMTIILSLLISLVACSSNQNDGELNPQRSDSGAGTSNSQNIEDTQLLGDADLHEVEILQSTPIPILAPTTAENVHQIEEIARFGKGPINDMALAPNGELIAVASEIGVYFYDARSFEEVLFSESEFAPWRIAFSPDSEVVAVSSRFNTMQLRRVTDGLVLADFEAHTADTIATSISFSPDGSLLAAGLSDYTIHIWDVESGRIVNVLELDKSEFTADLVFSPIGTILATASISRQLDDVSSTIRLWQVPTGELLNTLDGYSGETLSLAYSPDGNVLAAGLKSGTTNMLRISDGELLSTLDGHDGGVNSLAFSKDGNLLASGSSDKSIRIWLVDDGLEQQVLEEHAGSVHFVAFTPDSQQLVSGSEDNAMKLWNIVDGTLIDTQDDHSASVLSVAISPTGDTIAAGSRDGSITLIHYTRGEVVELENQRDGAIQDVAFSPDGTLLIALSTNVTIKSDGSDVQFDSATQFWRVDDGRLLNTIDGSVVFSPNGKSFIVSNEEVKELWRIDDGQQLLRSLATERNVDLGEYGQQLRKEHDGVFLDFSPNGELLATRAATDDEADVIEIISVIDGTTVSSLADEKLFGLTDLVFKSDGNNLVTTTYGGIQLWLVTSGFLFNSFETQDSISSVVFHPAGNVIATGTHHRGSIHLWSTTGEQAIHLLEGHTNSVNSLAFNSSGILVSGSADGTVRIWGIQN